MLKFIFLQICLFFILLGCTQQAKTPAKLEISIANFAAGVSSATSGGVYLYAFGPNGRKFGKIINNLDHSETLPNGVWSFYAVAWEGQGVGIDPNPNLSGVARCGAVKNVNLTGSAVNLDLTLTKLNCSNSDFTNGVSMATVMSGASAINFFPRFMLEVCKAIPDAVNDLTKDRMLDMYGCSYDFSHETDPQNKGYLGSIKVAIESFEKIPGSEAVFGKDQLKSRCVPISATSRGSISDTFIVSGSPQTVDFVRGLNIPVGSPNAPFPFKIIGYYASANCEDVIEVIPREFVLMDGRLESTYNVVGKIFGSSQNGSESSGKIFLQTTAEEVCNVRGDDSLRFAGGVGTKGQPYLICSVEQFNLAHSPLSISQVTSFKLLNDIDFLFTNVIPIGENPNGSLPFEFQGNFDGDYHRIKNIIYSMETNTNENLANVGLIRRAVGATIGNLIFENVSFECHLQSTTSSCRSVGIVAGSAKGSAAGPAFFKNILINRGHVSGVRDVGGVVGTVEDGGTGVYQTIFTGVHALAMVEAECDLNNTNPNYVCQNLGGLVGSATKASLTNSSAKVSVNSDRGHINVGGLVGNSNNVSMDSVFSNGNISAKDAVGGVIGEATNSILTNSYSFANVRGFDQNPAVPLSRAGGLVGVANILTLTNTFHSVGRVDTNSATPNYARALVGDGGDLVNCVNSHAQSSNLFSMGGSCGDFSYSQLKSKSELNTNAGSNAMVGSSMSDAPSFIATDDTYDYPHLKWEKNQLPSFGFLIPYVSTSCFGKMNLDSPTAGSGLGTEASPFEICTKEQLSGIAWGNSSYYFKLMRDIDFEFSSPGYLGESYVLSAHFDGGNHAFRNIFISLNTQMSLYEKISSSGEIMNLDLDGVGFGAMNSVSVDGNATVASLAQTNNGLIKNVNLYGSELDTTKLSFGHSNQDILSIGGLVGENNGVINKAEVDTRLTLIGPNSPLGDMDQIWIGGIAAKNYATIDGVKSRLKFFHSGTDANSNFMLNQTSDFVKMGSIAGENAQNATISKVEGSVELTLQNSIGVMSGASGNIFMGGLVGENSGSIDNSFLTDSRVLISLGSNAAFLSYIGGLIGKNTSDGSLDSSYAQFKNLQITDVSAAGGLIGNNAKSALPTTNTFCVVPSGASVDTFGTTSGTEHPQCFFDGFVTVTAPSDVITLTKGSTVVSLDWDFILDPLNRDETDMGSTPWLLESNSPNSFQFPRLRKTQKWFRDIH